MSVAWQYYAIVLLVYLGVNVIAIWALNLQYGLTGIMNFAFIIFQAIGAYVAAVTTLGSSVVQGGFQQYVLGWSLPWPIPILLAAIAGGILAFLVGTFTLGRRVGRALQGMVLIIVSIIATTVVSTTNWFNGATGLAEVPQPLEKGLGIGLIQWGWTYVGIVFVFCVATYVLVHRISSSPYGRRLRSIRENSMAAEALGVNVQRETMIIFVVGGVLAAISGALLVQFIGAWAPSGWMYSETFLYLAAIIVGGAGNNFGVALGVAIVWTVILQSVQYLPMIGNSGVIEALQLMGIGVLILCFIWFRPQGLVPERLRRFPEPLDGRAGPLDGSSLESARFGIGRRDSVQSSQIGEEADVRAQKGDV
jgi:branched-chain amino acid transport system permease protein